MAFDLDGTLLDDDKKIPERNARALKAAAEKGIKLMLCSGRAFEVQAGFAQSIGIDPICASANGARIDLSLHGPLLCENPIEPHIAKRIFDELMARGIYFMAYARGRSYMFNIDEQQRLNKHHHAPGKTFYGDLPFEIIGDSEAARHDAWQAAYKFVCFGEDYDPRFEEMKRVLADLNLSISSSWRDNMEIMKPGIDKGWAIRRVCEEYGIPIECTMAFGDNTNDLPMLAEVGWPCAVDNAVAEVRACARILAPCCEDDGVAQIIEKILEEYE